MEQAVTLGILNAVIYLSVGICIAGFALLIFLKWFGAELPEKKHENTMADSPRAFRKYIGMR